MRSFREEIKTDGLWPFSELYEWKLEADEFNYTSLTLLQKKKKAVLANEFRPIALENSAKIQSFG